jgi:hypothetical protein
MKTKYLIFSTILFIVFTMHCNTAFNNNNADYEVASAFFNEMVLFF